MGEHQENQPVPEATMYDLFRGYFSRQDRLLEYMAESQRQILMLLRAYAPPTLIVPPAAPAAPSVSVEVAGVTVQAYEKLLRTPLPVTASPFGRIKKKGTQASVSTTYVTVCEIEPSNGKTFEPANFSLSGYGDDMFVKLVWQDKDLTPVFYIPEHWPLQQWFPPRYYTDEGKPLLGDGKSKLQLKVRAEDGTVTVCDGELVGDES